MVFCNGRENDVFWLYALLVVLYAWLISIFVCFYGLNWKNWGIGSFNEPLSLLM